MVEAHSALGVAAEAMGERPGAVRPLPLLHQVANGGIVEHCGSTSRRCWNSMTVGPGTPACRSEHELPMWIIQDAYGDRHQCTAMLGVTPEA